MSRTRRTLERGRNKAGTASSRDAVAATRHHWWIAAAIVFGALLWGFWPIIAGLVKEWRANDDYSVGQLVPLATLYLIWTDRVGLRRCSIRPTWWGLALIFIAEACRWLGLAFMFESAERYALVLMILGLVLLLLGRQVFWKIRWVLVFLFLMVPLPGRIHNSISGPLQGQATAGAGVVLELLGVTVAREGNVIVLNDHVPLAVAEACSGLRMLTAFVVVGATLAYLIDRPRWQKATLVASTIPVAILCNLIRLVATALLFLAADNEFAERFFHDFAGLTMMPMAVLILFGELWIMSHLVVKDQPAPVHPRHKRAGGTSGRRATQARSQLPP